TGCSSGIGRHTIEALLNRGYNVIATSRKQEDVECLRSAGFNSFQLDVTCDNSIQKALEKILTHTNGTLYALFNNSGYGLRGAVEDLPTQVLRDQFETNFFGMHALTKKVIPIMRAQGYGRIIQNSSLMGFVGLKYRGAYTASKYAMEGWSDVLRQELAGSGIHVSLIQTGPVLSTNFRKNSMPAFKGSVDLRKSVHNSGYKKMIEQQKSTRPMNFSVSADAISSQVIHALENPRPKVRYRVGFPVHLFAIMKSILPNYLMDYLLVNWSHSFFTVKITQTNTWGAKTKVNASSQL
ncbi:MAG: SDR family NAD(P)-dependent oxidoreductase, partial [Magnetococcales bacterium]|nr:SDR family NAD(P)-dependent oxidoreductase [Magnetococcales bacterium]